MSGYVLHDYYRSSASYRVRIALNLKGIDYARHDVSLLDGSQRTPEHMARSAQGFVPVLELPGGRMLVQSLAIIDWLDAAHPQPLLTPADPLARADAMARALVIAADTHPVNNLRILKRLETQFGADEAAKGEWYRHWIAEGFAALEAMAGSGPFLGGGAPDVSDVLLVPQMYNARRFELPLDPYPRLVAADAAASALAPFAAAHPDRAKPE